MKTVSQQTNKLTIIHGIIQDVLVVGILMFLIWRCSR